MASILEVTASTRKVKTHKYGEVEVHGLSIEGIVYLLRDHPELMALFKDEGKTDLAIEQIMSLGIEVGASFLAAGLGFPGNQDAIAKCKAMNAEDALEIGTAVLAESFPGGAMDFFQKVTLLANQAQLSAKVTKSSQEPPKQES